MREKHREENESTGIFYDELEDYARGKIREHLQDLLEQEVTEWLGREKSERKGNVLEQPGYRNGYGKTRRLIQGGHKGHKGVIKGSSPLLALLEFFYAAKPCRRKRSMRRAFSTSVLSRGLAETKSLVFGKLRLFCDDLVAQINALVTDINGRPGD
jgi:hypothetical protein